MRRRIVVYSLSYLPLERIMSLSKTFMMATNLQIGTIAIKTTRHCSCACWCVKALVVLPWLSYSMQVPNDGYLRRIYQGKFKSLGLRINLNVQVQFNVNIWKNHRIYMWLITRYLVVIIWFLQFFHGTCSFHNVWQRMEWRCLLTGAYFWTQQHVQQLNSSHKNYDPK